MRALLESLFAPRAPDPPDGFGQSGWDDLRFALRFRRQRRVPTAWRAPTDEERRRWDDHPIIGRFGDYTTVTAEIDGRQWLVRERIWFGWPDAPEHACFALDPDGSIWCAVDFNDWPSAWTRPDAKRSVERPCVTPSRPSRWS